MGKKLLFGIVILTLVFSVVAAACAPAEVTPTPVTPTPTPVAPTPAAPEVLKWRMQSIDTPAIANFTEGTPLFINSIEEASNGRIEIELFPSGAIVSAMEMPAALAAGTIELAYTTDAYYTGMILETAIAPINIPAFLLKTSFEDAVDLFRYGGIEDILREAYAEHGVHYVTYLMVTPQAFWSKEPMYSVDDLKGFKIRTSGYLAKSFELMGASAVYLPHSEVYTGIATGVIDGSATSADYYEIMKLYEVCPYYYLPHIQEGTTMCILASLDTWNALPDDLKSIVEVAAVEYIQNFYSMCWHKMQHMYRTMEEKYGTTIITWSDEDVGKMREASLTLLPEIAAKSPRCAEGIQIIEDYLRFMGYVD